MCTAATYHTKVFYFGSTLDYEFTDGDEITVTAEGPDEMGAIAALSAAVKEHL